MSKRRSGPNPFASNTPRRLRLKQEQSRSALTLSPLQVEILRQCAIENELSELMETAYMSDRIQFRNEVLYPLLETGFLEMTIPTKSRSSKQKYRLSEKGMAYLKRLRNLD